MLTAPAGGDGVDDNPNDIALRMVLNETADVMYVYADQAKNYKTACEGGDDSGKDCDLWNNFGTTFAYIGTGKYGYMANGTTLILSRKNSGIVEEVEPCLQAFMATEAYYDICVQYGYVDDCFPNSHFPSSSGSESTSPYNMATDLHETSCTAGDYVGYCGCDATCPTAAPTESSETTTANFAPATFVTSTVVAAAVAVIAVA